MQKRPGIMISLASTTIAIALLLALMLIGTIIGARAQSSTAAQRQAVQNQQLWPIRDLGRSQGYVTGPGMPKCNPSVSEECRRLYGQPANRRGGTR